MSKPPPYVPLPGSPSESLPTHNALFAIGCEFRCIFKCTGKVNLNVHIHVSFTRGVLIQIDSITPQLLMQQVMGAVARFSHTNKK